MVHGSYPPPLERKPLLHIVDGIQTPTRVRRNCRTRSRGSEGSYRRPQSHEPTIRVKRVNHRHIRSVNRRSKESTVLTLYFYYCDCCKYRNKFYNL